MNEITKFVTFYSYKGGVGRTSALVNVAIHLALSGNNVLILDFDLEAPGTSAYLQKVDPNYDEHREGLLEYFAAATDGARVPNLAEKAIDLTPCLEGQNGGRLWVINAGNTIDKNYTASLENLKWSEIFDKKFGELLLKNFRNQIVQEFERPDYVLIDSRTGITETGGVCTRYLADVLVILTSLNEQNINGTRMIYEELSKERKETILVAANVPAGMPYGHNELFSERVEMFRNAFGRYPILFIYYYPVLSLSEEVPVLLAKASTDKENNRAPLFQTDPLLQSYTRLAQIIDRRRREEISYTDSLKKASEELHSHFYTREKPLVINVLKQYYSERFLAKIILDIVEFVEDLQKSISPKNWDKAEYKRLVDLGNVITNSSVKLLIEGLQDFIFQNLREYLNSGGTMDRSFESFSRPEKIDILIVGEISNLRFDWPIDYLQRALGKAQPEEHLQVARTLFNLSHCLLRVGRTESARKHLKPFLEEFRQLDLDKYSTVIRANYHFCAALAYKELGLKNEAKKMQLKSREQTSFLKPTTEVFSPLDYRMVPLEKFIKQLEASVD